ncbi:major capsid protein P2 [Reinekea thalattae]|uniref:Uncharacterized protein n=1 Tax=Reinekea thalattae TaxID=2593301 RepID=A0A5C8Z4G1_9GAMM|nr:major capsid protein P2 [Reinekea thalattae]TXR52061.1 hypothetical protein FME95_11640 [Reinekea thalattae]
MRPIIELNSFSAVAAGQTANLVLDKNVKYDQIYLQVADVADIEWIKLRLNTSDILPSLTPSEISAINYRKGNVPKNQSGSYIALPMQMLDAVLADSQRVTGLPVGDTDDCILQVKLKSDATAPTLSAFAEVSPFTGSRGVVRLFERYTVPASSAGLVNWTNLERGSRVARMYFSGPTIEHVTIKRDMTEIWDLGKDQTRMIHGVYGADCTVDDAAGFSYVFDAMREGFPIKDSLVTSNGNIKVDITVAAAGTIDVLVERLTTQFATTWTAATTAAAASAAGKSKRKVGRAA